jgi:hypothetical protein
VNFGGLGRLGKNNTFTKLKAHLGNDIEGIGCPAHILHNTIQTAADQLSCDVEQIVMKIFGHFSIYSAFFLTVAIENCMVKLIPPVNFCSDENTQTIFGTKLEDFLNYRIDYNSIS